MKKAQLELQLKEEQIEEEWLHHQQVTEHHSFLHPPDERNSRLESTVHT